MITTHVNTLVHKHRTIRQVTINTKLIAPQYMRVSQCPYPYMNQSTLTPNQSQERGYISVRYDYTIQPHGLYSRKTLSKVTFSRRPVIPDDCGDKASTVSRYCPGSLLLRYPKIWSVWKKLANLRFGVEDNNGTEVSRLMRAVKRSSSSRQSR
jgi:hypothetical protein